MGLGVGGGECSLEVVAWELGRLSESLSSNGGPASGSGIIACSWCAKLKFSWFASAEQNFWLARILILENLPKRYLCFPDTHKDTKGQGLSQD